MSGHPHKVELSAVFAVLGVILLFSGAVIVTLIAPNFVDSSWKQPSSEYQVQMYEVSDPNFYISGTVTGGQQLQYVNHLKQDFSLLAFIDSETFKIKAPAELEKYVTRGKEPLKLTSRLLLLRKIDESASGDTYELYDPQKKELFAFAPNDGILQDWVDKGKFNLIDGPKTSYHEHEGVIYISNPVEYLVSHFRFNEVEGWQYDPKGREIKGLEELTAHPFTFRSRKELIAMGEHIYAIEGCWYCHTDQTRTLVQDVVMNGSDSFPAPPSSPNEYIYEWITFPGTKRNGPDISRVGVKKPSRDWHKGHFWSPKTASAGSIMPSFRHFFDFDPRGTARSQVAIPNYQFEAIYQYLMTKGTRITPPNQAWWLGKDPVQTIDIIEGKKTL